MPHTSKASPAAKSAAAKMTKAAHKRMAAKKVTKGIRGKNSPESIKKEIARIEKQEAKRRQDTLKEIARLNKKASK